MVEKKLDQDWHLGLVKGRRNPSQKGRKRNGAVHCVGGMVRAG